MATIKTTASQEKTIEKINRSLSELEKVNLALATLRNGGSVHISVDIDGKGGGRGRAAKAYTASEKTGKVFKAVSSELGLSRTALKKEISSIVSKNEWLSLSEREQNILKGKIPMLEAPADEDDAADRQNASDQEPAYEPEPDEDEATADTAPTPRREKPAEEDDFDAMLAKANAEANANEEI